MPTIEQFIERNIGEGRLSKRAIAGIWQIINDLEADAGCKCPKHVVCAITLAAVAAGDNFDEDAIRNISFEEGAFFMNVAYGIVEPNAGRA